MAAIIGEWKKKISRLANSVEISRVMYQVSNSRIVKYNHVELRRD